MNQSIVNQGLSINSKQMEGGNILDSIKIEEETLVEYTLKQFLRNYKKVTKEIVSKTIEETGNIFSILSAHTEIDINPLWKYVINDRNLSTDDSIAIFDMLLQHGADLNYIDDILGAPLHWAIYFNKNADLIKYLLDSGANPNLLNKKGEHVISYLFEHNFIFTDFDSVKLLLKAINPITNKQDVKDSENLMFYIVSKADDIKFRELIKEKLLFLKESLPQLKSIVVRFEEKFHENAEAILKELGVDSQTENFNQVNAECSVEHELSNVGDMSINDSDM